MEASVTVEEGLDDYVVIDVVRGTHGEATPSTSSNPSPCSSPAKSEKMDTSSLDSGYDDFVIVDEQPEEDTTAQSQGRQRKALYGIRLFEYSPESEGNIFITNEEL